MRAHQVHFRDGNLAPGVFRKRGRGMSVDWDKYSSPQETKSRAKQPSENAVVQMPVAGIRATFDLDIERTPEPENRSHSDVLGIPDDEGLTEIRILLLNLAEVVLPLSY